MDKITLGPAIDFVAIDLYQGASCTYAGGGSYVLSPLSILYAGALMFFGANGPTKDNLNTILHFRTAFGNKSDIIKGIFENNAKMLSLGELQDPKKSTAANSYKLPAEVALLNGVFYDPSLKIKTDFVQSIQKTLKAGVYEQALGKTTEAEKTMNDWVTVNTFDKINNLVSSKSISPKSNIALINTLYFKSSWNVGFPSTDPVKDAAPFYHLDGNVSQPVYLTASRGIPYAEDDELDVQYVELPYKGEYYLSIILPRQKDGIRNCEHQLNSHALRALRAKVPALKAGHQRVVQLKLPKFRVEGSFDLAKLLAKVGVTHALGEQADFSQMAAAKPTFSNMYHKVAFEINEYGTEAAAQSASKARKLPLKEQAPGASWEPDYAPVDFIADHPFVFALQHRPTESLLFIGRVESPNQQKQ